MKIAITGASGLVGNKLTKLLQSKGHQIYRFVRSDKNAPNTIYWNPEKGEINAETLEGLDAIVHLAGENIASGRWNETVKKRIWDSRIQGTRLLVDTLKTLKTPPRVLVSASAMGYYGNRGDDKLTEESGGDESFLSRLCQAWEAEALKAEEFGTRVVCVRIGLVLSKDGGALKNMLTPFKLGLGGVVGSGIQYMSWITIDDLLGVFVFALENDTLQGSINGGSPNPVTNAEFTKALGGALGRPTIFPLPTPIVRLVFGEMGESLLLCSTRMYPKHLEEAGFKFQDENISEALNRVVI